MTRGGGWPPAGTLLTEAHIAAGHWKLVRRVACGHRWHPATDQLRGTDQYDHGNGTYSRRFDGETFDEFLFTTGDMQHWLWCTRAAAIGDYYENAPREVLASSSNAAKHHRKWYHRSGTKEDPWISLKDHWDDDRTTQIYGENNCQGAWNGAQQHVKLVREHDGACVYIRSSTRIPDGNSTSEQATLALQAANGDLNPAIELLLEPPHALESDSQFSYYGLPARLTRVSFDFANNYSGCCLYS